MIAPRRVNLVRVTTLAAAQRALALLATAGSPASARDRSVLVPTRSAAEELRRTIEALILVDGWTPPSSAYERLAIPAPSDGAPVVVLPAFATRDEWYHHFAERASDGRHLLTLTERELLLGLAADEAAAAGHVPPFAIRAGIVAEMLSLYDAVRRRLRATDDFERVLVERLEAAAEYDRGAARLLQQTRFLVASFRGYEARLAAGQLLDEHRLRARLAVEPVPRPWTHLVLAVADRVAEPGGLWPVDFDLVLTVPGLERIDVVATDGALSAGWYERLHVALPELEVCDLRDLDVPRPVLAAPDREQGGLVFTFRDREDELAGLAHRIGAASETALLDETAVVYQRPLPYLYLARQVLDEAGLPWEATDALPLAAEPYASAFALVLDTAVSAFSRESIFAVVSSPIFGWGADRWTPSPRDLGWLERRLDAAGLFGTVDDVRAFAAVLAGEGEEGRGRAGRLAGALEELADGLGPLVVPGPVTDRAARLTAFLDAHDRPPSGDPELVARQLRARAAVRAALDEVSRASSRFGDRVVTIDELALLLTRWIEARTFQPRVGHGGGIRLVDAVAARFGRFSRVHVVGLVEGEWPEKVRQTVFYPASLLRDLGWPAERDRQLATRAAFFDLLSVAASATSLSTFTLEQDALVRPSVFLEDLEPAGLAVVREQAPPADVVSAVGALAYGLVAEEGLPERTREAAVLRASRTSASDARFHGASGPWHRTTHAVTAIETYLACPFKYFASRVLRLEEEGGDEVGLDPRERGRLVHEVFQAFFDAWGARGHLGITTTLLQDARRLFSEIVESRLSSLPAAEREAERVRLLGSVASPGMGERVLRLEAERDLDLEARLLEFDLAGEYDLPTEEPRRARLRGIADRIDLTADGHLRLFDYKTGRPPHRKRAIQLPIYALCAERKLDGVSGRTWRVGEAAYLALSGPRAYAAVITSPEERDDVIAEGAARLAAAVDAIERGEFPPRPAELSLCASCAWAAVCRKDYVDPPA